MKKIKYFICIALILPSVFFAEMPNEDIDLNSDAYPVLHHYQYSGYGTKDSPFTIPSPIMQLFAPHESYPVLKVAQ